MKSDEKLIPVRDVHCFNEDQLAEYLRARLPGFKGPLKVL